MSSVFHKPYNPKILRRRKNESIIFKIGDDNAYLHIGNKETDPSQVATMIRQCSQYAIVMVVYDSLTYEQHKDCRKFIDDYYAEQY